MAAARARQSGIQLGIASRTERRKASFRQSEQSRRNGRIRRPLSRWDEFRDDVAPIRHEYAFTRTHVSYVFAQPILQLPNTHRFHGDLNVASRSYIVKLRLLDRARPTLTGHCQVDRNRA